MRQLAVNPPKLDTEQQEALLKLVNRFKNESSPLNPETFIPLEDVAQLTIEKHVSTMKGKWRRFSPEAEATAVPRRVSVDKGNAKKSV